MFPKHYKGLRRSFGILEGESLRDLKENTNASRYPSGPSTGQFGRDGTNVSCSEFRPDEL
jgi:hypothetical protein